MSDAAALVDALLHEGLSHARLAGEELVAPHLIDLEVLSAIRRKVATGHITTDQADAAIASHVGLEISRFPHRGLLARAWELRHNLTPYDAAYVALAEILELTLVTRDGSMAGVPGIRCTVEVIPAP